MDTVFKLQFSVKLHLSKGYYSVRLFVGIVSENGDCICISMCCFSLFSSRFLDIWVLRVLSISQFRWNLNHIRLCPFFTNYVHFSYFGLLIWLLACLPQKRREKKMMTTKNKNHQTDIEREKGSCLDSSPRHNFFKLLH